MKFKFEKLKIWRRAIEYSNKIHFMALKFPKIEQFNLSDQVRRAGDSIALNIAEGSIGQSNKEMYKFIGYSIRSLAEVVTCLYLAKNRNYLTNKEFEDYYDEAFNLMNMISAFKNKINYQ